MPLPENYNSSEHLQSVIRLTQNRIVREEFSDVGDDTWDTNITTARASLRVACTHVDSDSLMMTQLRNDLFYLILRKGRDFHPPIYGMPAEEVQQHLIFKPEVELIFAQDADAVPEKKATIRAVISFRLMNESSASMTQLKAETLAKAIKSTFITGGAKYSWDKGKFLCTYKDPERGYNLQIYALSELEGETVVKKILNIQNHTYDSDKFTLHKPSKDSVNNPTGTVTVYGKQKSKPRWRPSAKVKFRYANLKLYGRTDAIHLVDTTGYWWDCLERA